MRVIIIFFIAFILISCGTISHKYSLQSKCAGMQPETIYSKMFAVFL